MPRTFPRDRRSQLSLGIFMGTWVYAILGLRSVRGTAGAYGEGSMQVARRLRFLLEEHLPATAHFRHAELVRRFALLEGSAGRGFSDAREAAMAHHARPQGHGPHGVMAPRSFTMGGVACFSTDGVIWAGCCSWAARPMSRWC
ncbi:DUF2254 domain-containing protein [Myxococcus sp. AB025B]|uniref:DUF2254 domain-containing protein n=1 Tax=Myxococcus sp. AB025B TaxID=2562794 RepID=UPI00210831DA|nr:DUF2254 domain-containing protein [Myxococcus sp. AB025B]